MTNYIFPLLNKPKKFVRKKYKTNEKIQNKTSFRFFNYVSLFPLQKWGKTWKNKSCFPWKKQNIIFFVIFKKQQCEFIFQISLRRLMSRVINFRPWLPIFCWNTLRDLSKRVNGFMTRMGEFFPFWIIHNLCGLRQRENL